MRHRGVLDHAACRGLHQHEAQALRPNPSGISALCKRGLLFRAGAYTVSIKPSSLAGVRGLLVLRTDRARFAGRANVLGAFRVGAYGSLPIHSLSSSDSITPKRK